MERAEKEMIRLDKQLKVSEDQYLKVRERNQQLSQRMKDEKMRTEEKEHSLVVRGERKEREREGGWRRRVTEGRIKERFVEHQ